MLDAPCIMADLGQSPSPCCETPDTAWSMTASWHASNHPSIGSLAEAAEVYFLIQIYLLSTQHIHTDHPGPWSREVESSKKSQGSWACASHIWGGGEICCREGSLECSGKEAAPFREDLQIYCTMNMFITVKECAPSKLASCYDPAQRFGSHRGEGNFQELMDWMSEEFEDDSRRWHEFFRQHIEYPTTLSKK